MHSPVRLAVRRLAIALLLAVAATLGANAATASAEWDVGQYDNCIDNVVNAELAGDITPDVTVGLFVQCCRLSGGVVDAGVPGGCGAPPAVAASNAPVAPPAVVVDPDVDAGPGLGTGPKPTKNPPKAPTAPAGDNDGGFGSGSGGNQNDSPIG
ncbi:hypothetical protein GR927_24125 [Mycolicibacterium sp. 3033]|nr:hypothetical protein [Mycolicibacterium aurantiacum]